MNIGYSFWGYLGDLKFDPEGNLASTPDGNAFYSWSIISEALKRGYSVKRIMPDRDAVGYKMLNKYLFNSWCREDREKAYLESSCEDLYKDIDWTTVTKEDVFKRWLAVGFHKFDVILHEWRMKIPGRNDTKAGQPDLFLQECIIDFAAKYKIPLIIFDLDYKISLKDIQKMPNHNMIHAFELGYKWKDLPNAHHVEIPFDFSHINDLPISDNLHTTLVYIGNRYERDWCIDKYIPENLPAVHIHGNWNEGGRESSKDWPNLHFCERLQTIDMYQTYRDSVATILLAKKEYLEHEFMTARLIEAVFYGTIPLFIEEYGDNVIQKYLGQFQKSLVVSSKEDIVDRVKYFRAYPGERREIIERLRNRLADIMDVKFFMDKLEEVQKDAIKYR